MINITFKNFIYLTKDEIDLVHQWRNSEYVRKNMVHKDIIPYEEHIKFCESLKTRKDKLYFLVSINDEPCGVYDLVDINYEDKSAESGIYVIEKLHRYSRAISRIANTLHNKLMIKKIRAKVYKYNEVAVFYNLVKLKGKLVKEDDEFVYFEFNAFVDDFDNHPFYKKYSYSFKI